jgi:tetratricopeptide (TPR) repeat protein
LLTSATSAAALGEPEVQGVIANHLAIVYGALRRFDDAAATFASAIPFFEDAGRPERVAQIRVNSAITVAQSGDPATAAKLLQEARHALDELEPRTGPSPIIANLRPTALLALAEALGETGRYDEAREVFPELLASAEAAGNTALLAIAWSNLGKIEHRGGRAEEAFACLDKALALHRATGNRDGEGFGLWALGEVRKSVGDVDGARQAWEQARALFEVLGQAGYVKDLTAAIAALGDEPTTVAGGDAADS